MNDALLDVNVLIASVVENHDHQRGAVNEIVLFA